MMKKPAIGEGRHVWPLQVGLTCHEGVVFDDPLDFRNMPDNIGTLGIRLDENGVRESGATG